MKVGDLVKVKDCDQERESILDFPCECFFCHHSSSRVGVVLRPEPIRSWAVMFDCGEWRLDEFDQARGDVKVISD